MGALISYFEKSDYEIKILYITEKVENWFFLKATFFNFYKKVENRFFLRFWLFLIIYPNMSKVIFWAKKIIQTHPVLPKKLLFSLKKSLLTYLNKLLK